jgi:hypothetical protein
MLPSEVVTEIGVIREFAEALSATTADDGAIVFGTGKRGGGTIAETIGLGFTIKPSWPIHASAEIGATKAAMKSAVSCRRISKLSLLFCSPT